MREEKREEEGQDRRTFPRTFLPVSLDISPWIFPPGATWHSWHCEKGGTGRNNGYRLGAVLAVLLRPCGLNVHTGRNLSPLQMNPFPEIDDFRSPVKYFICVPLFFNRLWLDLTAKEW